MTCWSERAIITGFTYTDPTLSEGEFLGSGQGGFGGNFVGFGGGMNNKSGTDLFLLLASSGWRSV